TRRGPTDDRGRDPSLPFTIFPGGQTAALARRRVLRGDVQRRAVVGAAQRRGVEQIQATVVARHGGQLAVLVLEQDGRRVEVRAVRRQPVLRLEGPPVEGDDA